MLLLDIQIQMEPSVSTLDSFHAYFCTYARNLKIQTKRGSATRNGRVSSGVHRPAKTLTRTFWGKVGKVGEKLEGKSWIQDWFPLVDALLMSNSMWSVTSLIFKMYSYILCLLLVTFTIMYVVPIQLGWACMVGLPGTSQSASSNLVSLLCLCLSSIKCV